MEESILKAEWAKANDDGFLDIDGGEREIKMHLSDGTGSPLFSRNGFGADIIRFPKGGKVGNHVHNGDHILFVLKGSGKVEYAGVLYDLYPGLSYLVLKLLQNWGKFHNILKKIYVHPG